MPTGTEPTRNMLAAVVGEANVRIVEQFLSAFNRYRLDRLIRLTRANQSISLPDGKVARGRLATGRLIAWILWRSRGTLRMTPLSVRGQGGSEVWVRTRNTATTRGDVTLDLEMALIFSVDSRPHLSCTRVGRRSTELDVILAVTSLSKQTLSTPIGPALLRPGYFACVRPETCSARVGGKRRGRISAPMHERSAGSRLPRNAGNSASRWRCSWDP